MEVTKRITAATLARQLGECNPNAEIGIVMGDVPLLIPVSSIAIRQNANNEEVVTLNLDHALLTQILDAIEDMMNNKETLQ